MAGVHFRTILQIRTETDTLIWSSQDCLLISVETNKSTNEMQRSNKRSETGVKETNSSIKFVVWE